VLTYCPPSLKDKIFADDPVLIVLFECFLSKVSACGIYYSLWLLEHPSGYSRKRMVLLLCCRREFSLDSDPNTYLSCPRQPHTGIPVGRRLRIGHYSRSLIPVSKTDEVKRKTQQKQRACLISVGSLVATRGQDGDPLLSIRLLPWVGLPAGCGTVGAAGVSGQDPRTQHTGWAGTRCQPKAGFHQVSSQIFWARHGQRGPNILGGARRMYKHQAILECHAAAAVGSGWVSSGIRITPKAAKAVPPL
jgi:hypothetical protein